MVVSRLLTNQKLYFGSGLDYYITPNIFGNMTPELEQLIDNSFKCAGRYQLLAKTVRGLFDVNQPISDSMPQTSSNVFFKWSHEMLQEIYDVMSSAENEKGLADDSTLNSTSIPTTAPVSSSVPVSSQNTTSESAHADSTTTNINNFAAASSFQEKPLEKTSSLNIYSDFHSIRDDYESLSPKNAMLDDNWFNKLVDDRMNSFMVTNQDLNFWKKPRGVGSTSEMKAVDENKGGKNNVNGYEGNNGVSTAPNSSTNNVNGLTMNGMNNAGFNSAPLVRMKPCGMTISNSMNYSLT
ncbi:unnamed protein product [Ambrosiozyma monospora]|uniref:Unnamed protein product n=1 Tax=Ambrosiozyma monospora TaxID=43982 RepID=A0ACB5U1P9_AMBMO|nr:unnamed protein product [Ambrosiozyma monospora]